jgi:hypothetical protein
MKKQNVLVSFVKYIQNQLLLSATKIIHALSTVKFRGFIFFNSSNYLV